MRLMKISSAYWLIVLTLFALLIRLPYWDVIPASFDEINTTVHGFLIAQGKIRPLVGDDAYAGPFYPYLLAGLFRLGVTSPMIGRVVILITGAITVPITYAWVAALSRNKTAGFIAALFVATNPDHILVNSHIGGASFIFPFFTTLFLYLLTEALNRDHPGWLVLSALPAGLALQSNPVTILLVAGGFLWLFWKTRHQTRLGRRWPLWPIVAGLTLILVYSPVVVYNLATRFDTVDVIQERTYLWEDNPTVQTAANNLKRLSFQAVRQVSGVVAGDETVGTLVGAPLIFMALMIAGLSYTTRYVSALPLVILLPFWLVLPIVSSHYGFLSVGRFTTQLLPVWAATIGILLAAGLDRFRQATRPKLNRYLVGYIPLLLLLNLYHVASLFQYYQAVNANHTSGRDILELSRYVVRENRGERVYISAIDELSFLESVPYVPHASFLIGDIHHEFLPPRQIIGRLFEYPGSAFLLLSDHDADIVRQVAPLVWVDTPANEEARLRRYGLYRLDTSVLLEKPEFVLTGRDLSDNLHPVTALGEGVQLMGCDLPGSAAPGEKLAFSCYWSVTATMPQGTYVGFVHLLDPITSTLVAQDDHILGQESYPLNAWQAGEVIQESYAIDIPPGTPIGVYQLLLGIYTWPDLTRLSVPGNPDNVVVLPLRLN